MRSISQMLKVSDGPVFHALVPVHRSALALLLIGMVAASGLLSPLAPAGAAASDELNFQARLLNDSGGVVPDGFYHVEFKLYDSAAAGASAQGVCVGGGTDDCLWVETHTGGNTVRVVNGYLTVQLGSLTSFPALDWGEEMWLSINIGGTSGPSWDGEMSPRMKVSSVPFAFDSERLDGLDSSEFVQIAQGEQAVNSASTLISIDQAGAGDLIDLQVANASRFTVTNSGNLTIAGLATTVGLNAGTGLIQGTGGLTVTGTITLSSLNCTGNANGGALTANGSGVLSCTDDDAGTSLFTDGGTFLYPTGNESIIIGGTTEANAQILLRNGNSSVFNEQGGAYSFRIESDNNAAIFFVDGTNDRVGIGSNAPGSRLYIDQDDAFPTIPVLTVKGASAQSGNSLEVRRNDDAIVFNVDASGNAAIGVNQTIQASTQLQVGDQGTIPAIEAGTRILGYNTSAGADNFGLSLLSGSTGQSKINFGDDSDENAGIIVYNNSLDSLGITVNTTERLSINSSGILTLSAYNCSGNANGGALTANGSGVISCTDDDNSGATLTLQQAYGNDADGSDTIIALTTADDSLIVRNPSASGTDSGYVALIDQLNTGSVDGLRVSNAGTGVGQLIDLTNTAGTQSAGLSVTRSGAGGTTTSLLALTQSGGTATNGILFTGTIGTDITTAATRALNIDSGTTGAINLGTSANAKTITLGNSTGATSVVVNCGTGACSFGANAIAHTTTVGSTTGAATTTLQGGTGGVNVGTGGIANTIQIGNTTGAVAQTINIGTNATASSTNTVVLGSAIGTSSTTINSGTGNIDIGTTAQARAINLGTAAAAQTVTLGSANTTSSLLLQSGTGDITLTSADQIILTGFNCSTNANGGALTTNGSGVLSCSDDDGGSSTTLQGAYNNGSAGDQVIALSSTNDSVIFRNPSSSGTDSGYVVNVDQLNTGGVDALRINNAGTGALLGLYDSGNLVGSFVDGGHLTANNSATGTTGNTESMTRVNVTSITLDADSFNVNDVIFFNNAGQDYFTRITVDNSDGTYTVSPAVSYDADVTVTKYNIQNIGATSTDYSTLSNRYFQGYFLGGIVVGAGSTTLSDGLLSSSGNLTLQSNGNSAYLPAATGTLTVTLAGGGGAGANTYSYSGSEETWVVPAGVTQITVEVAGGKGGNSSGGILGGEGTIIESIIDVTPGETLRFYVGQAGGVLTAGYNGGGTGTTGNFGEHGGGGGGASDIRRGGSALANRILAAAGGGGAMAAGVGGDGGDPLGYDGAGTDYGRGATLSAGGAGGGNGNAGALGVGGNAGTNPGFAHGGGGGGGGYYGGGGGGTDSGTTGSGGGGSSLVPSGGTSIVGNTSNGYINVSWVGSGTTGTLAVYGTNNTLLDSFITQNVDTITVGAELHVTGYADFDDDLNIDGNLTVGGTTDLVGNLTISAGSLSVSSGATVNGGAVFNEPGADVDFRVESDTRTEALFVNGADGYIGFGTNTPSSILHLRPISSQSPIITGNYDTAGSNSIINLYENGTGNMILQTNFSGADILFNTNGANDRLRIYETGNIVVNEPGNNADFRIEGDTVQNLFFTDASTDSIGVGTNAPGGLFEVQAVTDANDVFVVEDASGQAYLTVDTESATDALQVRIGAGTDDVVFTLDGFNTDPTGSIPDGSMFYDADDDVFRCRINGAWANCDTTAGGGVQILTFLPEFSGGTFDPDGSNNQGTLVAGVANGLAMGEGYKHNYYDWSTTQGTAQDYDVVILVKVPSDYQSIGAASTFKFWHNDPDGATTNAQTTWTVFDHDETQCFSSAFNGASAGVWEQESASSLGSCAFSANDIITFRFKLATTSAAGVLQLGEFQFEYSK